MARKFFYVCAGLFLLSLAYNLGASTAGAQGGIGIVAAGVDTPYGSWAVIGRQLFQVANGVLDDHRPPFPGTSPAIACGADRVVLQSGEVYRWNGGTAWVLDGTFPSGPTPAQQESWGQLKARYR